MPSGKPSITEAMDRLDTIHDRFKAHGIELIGLTLLPQDAEAILDRLDRLGHLEAVECPNCEGTLGSHRDECPRLRAMGALRAAEDPTAGVRDDA